MRSASAAMTAAARDVLASLAPEQEQRVAIPFDSEERSNWHFTPRMRRGLPFAAMDAAQRHLAHGLLATGLSAPGYLKATTIMSLEPVLRELEGGRGFVRDADRYYFSIFGSPGPVGVWGWRVEGHHISLNFTVADGVLRASPSFFGANPAEVAAGPRAGLRALPEEEDLARELLCSMTDRQRARAVIETAAPDDILSYNHPRIEAGPPQGIAMSQLAVPQVDLLMALLDVYADAMPAEVARARWEAIRRAHWDDITFAWAGSPLRGEGHYYRIQGPEFLVEYDNTQDNANHIHSVWRDFAGDFGRDLLREHYHAEHHHYAPAGLILEVVEEPAESRSPLSDE